MLSLIFKLKDIFELATATGSTGALLFDRDQRSH